MLDETLPPGGDNEPAAAGPADESAESAARADEGAPAAMPEPVAAPPAETPTDTPADAPAQATAEQSATDAAGEDAAAVDDAGTASAAPTPAAAPEMSPAACAALLAEHFPGLFAAGRALPIKLRVQVDIQARTPGVFPRKAMSLFLHRYTTSTAYLKALVSLPHRFDLDGAPAGDVAAEHREAAQVELQRRQAIVQERRRMERQARPGAGPRGRAPGDPAAGTTADLPPAAPAAEASPAGEGRRPPRGPGAEGRPRPPQQQQRARRDERRPHPGGMPGHGRADGPRRESRPPRPPMPPRPETDGAGGAQHPRPEAPARQTNLPPAEIEARRERAALLRAYESSTLTKANFCVLKRVSEADLDSALAQARQERGETPPRPGR